ncbi:MAG: aspartate--tRNA ligase [Thermoanaerobaculia bacterium]|nr:aspartate--tRNA ligase [Thermoanaerobaculia bacterium]
MKRIGAGTLTREAIGTRVRLQAWVQRCRNLGGLLFVDLRDRTGVAQVVVHPETRADLAALLEPVRAEWVLEVEGTVVAREPAAVNPRMATGEVEVEADRIEVLSKSDPLPFQLDDRAEALEETRLRYRYLDLRRPELQRNLELRHRITHEARQYFHEQGFLEIETPILTKSTPEGARDYLVPSRVHRGEFYALPQSPQLFKQLLMVAGFERYLQIARCFRDEDLRADRQPEFTQIDLELSFPTEEEIFGLIEGLFARVLPLVGVAPALPFPRLTYAEAMARYGSDRPDLRFELPITDLSGALGSSGFRGFREAVEQGGVVRGIAVPGAAGASRKQADGWAELARRSGAAGVLTLRRLRGELAFTVKNSLTAGEMEAAAAALGLEEGGLAVLVAGPERSTAEALGALRLELARTFGLVPEGRWAFLWVHDFPLLERDPEAGRWVAMHHPFTSPDPRDLARLESDPGQVRARAYDVVLNGTELGGGSIRIHDREVQERVFRLLGIEAAEARERFGFLLDALRLGAPPHGGLALGLDRMVMLMAGATSLRDVIAFPKTASATCLMTEAPSAVDARQLAELGVALSRRPEAG